MNTKSKRVAVSIFQVVILFGLCFSLIRLLLMPYVVSGESMVGTLQDGDMMYGLRYNVFPKQLERGEIVTIQKETEFGLSDMVKRIIALPGDFIEIEDNKVYLNGELLVENYIAEPMRYDTDYVSYLLGDDEYFVMGDNRNHSGDSREYGPVYDHEITSYTVFRVGHKDALSLSVIY